MTVWCILLTPVFIYITLQAKSVIAAAVLHGTLNASVGIPIMVIKGGNDLTTGITGLPGFIALFLTIMFLLAYDTFVFKQKLMSSKIEDYM